VRGIPGGKKTLLGLVGLIVVMLLGYRLLLHQPPVAVMAVTIGEVQGSVHGPGTVQSRVPVTVSTKITAILEKLHADQGDRVQKGQLLAELDAAELKARAAAARAGMSRAERELLRAQAAVAKALANLALAQGNYQRDLEVFKPGYISKAAFDITKAGLKVAESEAAEARAALAALQAAHLQSLSEVRAAEANLNYTRIVAPMDGLITVRKAEVGNTVSPGTPIFQMVDLEQIWVAAWIDQALVGQLRLGQKALIRLRSGRRYLGKVVRLNAEADTVTHELEVDVKFDHLPEPLVIGEEAEVDIDTGKVKAPAVPLTAILERDGKTGVLVVEQGRIVFRPVKPGPNDGKRIAVLEGLKEGDLVVAQPANLNPGTRVKAEIKTPEAKEK